MTSATGSSVLRHDAGVSRGFTAIEMLLVIVILSLLAVVTYPNVANSLRGARIDRASRVVAMDLQQALAAAARERAPVRISQVAGGREYVMISRRTDDTLLTRRLTGESDYQVTDLIMSPTMLDVYPTGRTSALFTATLREGGREHVVRMSRAGQVRIRK